MCFGDGKEMNMKIIDNVKRTLKFGELEVGQTFKYMGRHYMKIQNTKNGCCIYHNSVVLTSGELGYFNNSTEITRFDCELIVL